MTRPTPRLVAHLVAHNEADRYLAPCLEWVSRLVDAIHVFDDASTDDTVDICQAFGATVTRRSAVAPGFAEHEGQFRAAGWHAFEQALRPDDHTWVYVPDCDEFLVADGDLPFAVAADIAEAESSCQAGVTVPVAEVFGWSDPRPLVRVDGYWGKITAARLARWRPGGTFDDRREGGGSIPTYTSPRLRSNRLTVLHMGYAAEADRIAKHQRYAAGRGHATSHVESIVAAPQLIRWAGPVPAVLAGHVTPPRHDHA